MSQSLQLLNSEILATISTVAGISRDPTQWSDADNGDVRQCIRRGMRKFFQPQPLPNSTIHQWRFLERKFYASAENTSPYNTGILRVHNGAAVLSGGTWPSWSLDGLIQVNGQIVYVTGVSGSDRTIDNSSIESNTITLDGSTITASAAAAGATIVLFGYNVASVDVGKTLLVTAGTNFSHGTYTITSINTSTNSWTLSANVAIGVASGLVGTTGYTYSLYRYRYPLPTDFAEFIGAVTYSNGMHTNLLKNTDDKEIRLRYAANFRTGNTSMYSIQHGNGTADTSAWYMSVWPTFDSGASVTAIYRSSPSDGLDITDVTASSDSPPVLDPVHAETLMAAILSSVDEIYNDRMDGIYHSLFLTRLEASIAHDRHAQANQDFYGCGSGNYPFNRRAYSLLYHVPTYDTV